MSLIPIICTHEVSSSVRNPLGPWVEAYLNWQW